jgi:hypothetical protein
MSRVPGPRLDGVGGCRWEAVAVTIPSASGGKRWGWSDGEPVVWWSTKVRSRDGNSGTGIRMIFYLWVTFVSDLNQDGYGTGIFFHLRVNT